MKRWIVAGILLVFLGGCQSTVPPGLRDDEREFFPLSVVTSEGEAIAFEVAIADTSEERFRGLQNVEYMNFDEGMWFIFEVEDQQTFWMKDTLISLDIIFVNAEYEIVSYYEAVPPCDATISLPCDRYPSGVPAQYVLELSGGMLSEYGIEIGDIIIPPEL